jgi:glycosyltransferase involved in cell wall biosynthesis
MRIAVVVPTFNAEAFAAAALESALAQTRRPDEIIVVDDGSTDGTVDLVQHLRAANRQLISLHRQPNGGPAAARNTGIHLTSADLIAPLDADDLFLPNHLAALENAFVQEPGAVLCFGDALVFTDGDKSETSFLAGKRLAGLKYRELENGLRVVEEPAFESLIPGNYIPVSGSLFSRRAALGVGFYNAHLNLVEDWDLNLRLSRVGPIAYYTFPIAKKREHDANATHRRNSVRVLRAAFECLYMLSAQRERLNLTDGELEALRDESISVARELLYAASATGWREYLGATRYLASRGCARFVVNPRDVARRFYRTIVPDRSVV